MHPRVFSLLYSSFNIYIKTHEYVLLKCIPFPVTSAKNAELCKFSLLLLLVKLGAVVQQFSHTDLLNSRTCRPYSITSHLPDEVYTMSTVYYETQLRCCQNRFCTRSHNRPPKKQNPAACWPQE